MPREKSRMILLILLLMATSVAHADSLSKMHDCSSKVVPALIEPALVLSDARPAADQLPQMLITTSSLPETAAKAQRLVAIGILAVDHDLPETAHAALTQAADLARALHLPRHESQALGQLGHLYEVRQHYPEALQLTANAVSIAPQERDLLLKWEWQRGRIHAALGQQPQALAAYRRAVLHIQAVRASLSVEYKHGRSSFRETLSPFYLGLVDLLLRQADQHKGAEQQALLNEAQQTMELLKTAELQDYFKDACAVTQTPLADLQDISPQTAVLYPIILPDRLELLVQIGNRKYSRSVDAPAVRLRFIGQWLVRRLRPTSGGALLPFSRLQAKRLYDLLIGPIEDLLKEHQIHTLIYLPDGILRSIPLAVLWDGEGFLIERYAVATVPGLTLLDPKPIEREGTNALVAGLSRPGNVVAELSATLRSALIGQPASDHSAEASRGLFRALPEVAPVEDTAAQPVLRQIEKEQLQDALALPGVAKEIERIADILPVRKLADEDFTLGHFEKEIEKSYRIVHIASHGIFSGDPKESFIITHDRLLDMNRLETLFKSEAFSDAPVEILTLSACQTAEGDDRSPLGLSGVALKSGARSALGSLWPVSDDAAQLLLPDFYRQLQNRDISKAQALRIAELNLMREARFQHPAYWSAFILIGNWL